MKKIIYLLSIIISTMLCCCSNKQTKSNTGSNTGIPSYDKLYDELFDELIHKDVENPNYLDTLYTEMYIAVKALNKGNEEECSKMICEKVDLLVELDTIKENQIHYLEAKLIAQRILKDNNGIIKNLYQTYNLYPENSFERLGSLGSLYLATNNNDSATYYLNKCLEVSKINLNSNNNEIKEKAIMGVCHSLVLLEKDQELKDILKEQLQLNPTKEIEDLIKSILDDFEGYKRMEWESINLLPQ